MRESGALTRISRRREKERRAGGDKRNGDHLPDAETPERGAGIAARESQMRNKFSAFYDSLAGGSGK